MKIESSKHILDSYTINREMPVNYVEGELDFCKKEFSYQTYDVRIIELKNCVVNYMGFAYEQGKFMLNKFSLLDEKRYKKDLTYKHYVKRVMFKRKRSLGEGRYLLAFDEWSNSHYHWFCDVIPRLFSMRELVKDYILLLPDSKYIREIGLATLAFFDLNPAGIEFIQEGELVRAKQLSIITHTCLTGYTNDKVMREMQGFILAKQKIATVQHKIYVSRDKARYRKVLNEEAVLEVVKTHGYEIAHFEDLSWVEQISTMASAKSMVSMHGAGLTNALFMNRGSAVLEFRRDRIYHNQCYWHLCAAMNLDYYYLFGQPDNEDLVLEGVDCCNLTIDPEKLHKTLLAIDNGK
ncbi:glycosyltransferase family 61 protein [Mucilaginibacter sp. HD30]